MKKPAPKLSRTLAQRTKLTKDQLKRVKGQAGEGLASRYTPDGRQSLELTRRLAKARKKARKFLLYSDQLGRRLFLSSSVKGVPLTFEEKEALRFFEGFDDPKVKKNYWEHAFSLAQYSDGPNTILPYIKLKVKHL